MPKQGTSETGASQAFPSSIAPGSRSLRRSPVVEIPVRNNGKRRRTGQGEGAGNGRRSKRQRGGSAHQTAHDGSASEELDGVLAEQQLRNEERTSESADCLAAEETECATRRFNAQDSEDRVVVKDSASTQEADLSRNATAEAFTTSISEDGQSVEALREVIESQFNLEILLKHRELRLIEQELAKCQIALEQLRRCRLIPYTTHTPTQAVPVPGNTNASTSSNPGAAPSDAPWAPAPGVTDGPYTRYYAQWLIQDPRFGDAVPRMDGASQAPLQAQAVVETRATRKAAAERDPIPGKGRLRGGPVSSKAKGGPGHKATKKERVAPPILKRSCDGQLVRLVCLDCQRIDFSSPQGFINHCRIAHQRGFESHEAAANACGQPVELDEAGQIIGDVDGSGNGPGYLVHPLVRAAPTSGKAVRHMVTQQLMKDASARTKRTTVMPTTRRQPSIQGGALDQAPGETGRAGPASSTAFNPSSQTPHLSAMMEKTGMGIDLASMILEATEKVDLGTSSSSEDEDEDDDDVVQHETNKAPRRSQQQRRPASSNQTGGRTTVSSAPGTSDPLVGSTQVQTTSATTSIGQHGSSNNVRKRSSRRQPLPGAFSTQVSALSEPGRPTHEPAHQSLGNERGMLSPVLAVAASSTHVSPTVAALLPTAPSLVTDDDDDEDDDEYEATSQSETTSSVVAGERAMEVEVEEEDENSYGTQPPPRPRPPSLPADVGPGIKPEVPGAANAGADGGGGGGGATATAPRGPTTRSSMRVTRPSQTRQGDAPPRTRQPRQNILARDGRGRFARGGS